MVTVSSGTTSTAWCVIVSGQSFFYVDKDEVDARFAKIEAAAKPSYKRLSFEPRPSSLMVGWDGILKN